MNDYYKIGMEIVNSNEIVSRDRPGILYIALTLAGYSERLAELHRLEDQMILGLVESGTFTWLTDAIYRDFSSACLSDMSLSEVSSIANSRSKLGTKLGMAEIAQLSQYIMSSCHYLQQTSPLKLKDVQSMRHTSRAESSLFHIFNSYLSEDYASSKEMLGVSNGNFVTISPVPYNFYYALSILIHAALYPHSDPLEKRNILKEIKSNVKKIKPFAEHTPDNFWHLYLIAQAELARIEGKKQEALSIYQQAIATAKEHDFMRWVAIANERAGELYLDIGDPTAAKGYIQDAIRYFRLWGCKLKVSLLKKKYAKLWEEEKFEKDNGADITSTSDGIELDLTAMLMATQAISSEIELDKLLPRILQVAVKSSGSDKAAFIGLKTDHWIIESMTEHKKDEFISTPMNEILTPESDLPEDFISGIIRSGEMEVISDLSKNEKYAKLPYVLRYQTKSALCLPIVRNHKVMAVLYLENQVAADTFTSERVQLLKALTAQIAISLENARHFEETQELFRSTERFVPKKFLELLGRNNIKEVSKGDNVKLEMSAIFADLRDFTTISESIEPEQLTYVLNTYLKYMSPIIRNNHGFVNRVLGDGILALFPNDPQDAVNASLEMLEALTPFNQEINAAGFESIKMGIGVNTGPAMLCALGEDERIEANVVSDMVNAASRIEGLNKLYGTTLLISDLTYNKLKDPSKFSIRLVDTVRVKGKTKPLSLYEVMPKTQDGRYFEDFQKALNLYTEGKFKAANQNFIKCLKVNPDDAVAQLYAERCKSYQDNAPDNWDGVTTMLEK